MFLRLGFYIFIIPESAAEFYFDAYYYVYRWSEGADGVIEFEYIFYEGGY